MPALVVSDVEDVAAAFRRMWLADPVMVAMDKGEISWGNLDLYCPVVAEWEKNYVARARALEINLDHNDGAEDQCDDEEEDEEEPFIPVASKPKRVVPSFTPGIKTIITRNLPRDITVEQLRFVFEKYGPIKDIYIPKNMDKSSPHFGTIKGFALIKFLKPENSATAFQDQYGRLTIGKNNIAIEFAKEDR